MHRVLTELDRYRSKIPRTISEIFILEYNNKRRMVDDDFMIIHFTNESFTNCSIHADYATARTHFMNTCRSVIYRCTPKDVEYGFIKSENSLGLDITDFGISSSRKEFRGVVFIINVTADQRTETESELNRVLTELN